MAKRDNSNINVGRFRQRTLAAMVMVLVMILFGRLFVLQVVRHDEFARFAEDNQLQRERVPSPRGYLRDRTGRILVDNVLQFEVVMSWRERGDVAAVAERLASYLPVDTLKVMRRFDAWKQKYGRAAFPLVPDADKFMISFVRENAGEFSQVRVKSRARRRYRGGETASHVLGYVGEAGDSDVARESAKRYFPGDMVGKTALERYCENDLRGTDGQRVLEVNASGHVLGEVEELSISPVPGQDIHLTLDARLQTYLEELLKARGRGAAVVMNVEDGAIVAAVSVPTFEPNEFATGITQASLNRLFDEKSKPLFNRLSQARYPPASIFKIVSTHAIMTNQLVNPNEMLVYCTGAFQFGNRTFRCWDLGGHGWMNLMSAIVQSCDVYFYKVAEIMDVDVLAASARAFGLGTATGIDLPGEVRGLVPDRAYYDKKFGKGRWTQGHMLNNIIGQGEYLVNVLQIVRIAAAVANGGFLVRPHLIQRLGEQSAAPHPRQRVVDLRGRTINYLRTAMVNVVEDDDGTANWVKLDWLSVGGKTGTAENPHGEAHALFTAYAPADAPEIAIAIIIENVGHGGEFAAPIARDFFSEYFRPGASDEVRAVDKDKADAEIPLQGAEKSGGGSP